MFIHLSVTCYGLLTVLSCSDSDFFDRSKGDMKLPLVDLPVPLGTYMLAIVLMSTFTLANFRFGFQRALYLIDQIQRRAVRYQGHNDFVDPSELYRYPWFAMATLDRTGWNRTAPFIFNIIQWFLTPALWILCAVKTYRLGTDWQHLVNHQIPWHWPFSVGAVGFVFYVAVRTRQQSHRAPWAGALPALLLLLGALASAFKCHPLQLRHADMTGLHLKGVDFSRAILSHAKLTGANLDHALLNGADLHKANLDDARLEFSSLQGKVDLTRAQLRRAKLAWANLEGATLFFAQLQNAKLDNAHLEQADLKSANLQGATLGDAHLANATLGDAHLANATLIRAQLDGANLTHADLEHANLSKASLNGGRLGHARLIDATLNDTNLTLADLQGANLNSASLRQANLTGAYLADASLEGADFSAASISQQILDGAVSPPNLPLDYLKQTKSAPSVPCGDAATKLPPLLVVSHCIAQMHR